MQTFGDDAKVCLKAYYPWECDVTARLRAYCNGCTIGSMRILFRKSTKQNRQSNCSLLSTSTQCALLKGRLLPLTWSPLLKIRSLVSHLLVGTILFIEKRFPSSIAQEEDRQLTGDSWILLPLDIPELLNWLALALPFTLLLAHRCHSREGKRKRCNRADCSTPAGPRCQSVSQAKYATPSSGKSERDQRCFHGELWWKKIVKLKEH